MKKTTLKVINLENTNLFLLNHDELQQIQGGHWFKEAIKVAVKVAEAVGVVDMLSDAYNGFKEGWNSVK